MKVRFFLLLLLAMSVVYSCTNEVTVPSEIKSGKEVSISFIAQPDVVVKAGTRGAVENVTTGAKFAFYAFKKGAGETYSFEKVISDEYATYEEIENVNVWKSGKALLPVGTYRFLCFYNLPATGIPTEGNLATMKNQSWDEIKNGFVIGHISATGDADVNEFFSGEPTTDVLISDNDIVVAIEPLKRVVSRIDVKFVKIAVDPTKEVSYGNDDTGNGNTIFGSAGNLKSIALNVKGAAKKFSMGTTKLTDVWSTDVKFNYGTEALEKLVVYGTSTTTSTFPKLDGSDMNDDAAMAAGIIKGGAYFRGAYILPFMDETKKLESIKIELTGGKDSDAKRIISATDNLLVKKNFVTLVTVKLQSTTPGEGPGDDKEHLFNPKVKFTVTVDSQFAGVSNSDVVVD